MLFSGLAGCGHSPFGKTVSAYWDQRSGRDLFTRDQVEKLPFATLAVTLGDLPRAMMVLMRAEGDDLHWVSADKAILVTRHGRIVKTVGLAAGNLANTVMLEADPLAPLSGRGEKPSQWKRSVDWQPAKEFGRTLVSDWQPGGIEEIQTYWGTRRARRIRETSTSPGANWTLENTFWLDVATGETVASLQNILPTAPSLKLEILKSFRS